MADPPQVRGRAKGRAKTHTRGPSATVAEGPGAAAAVGPTPLQPTAGRRNHRGAPRTDVVRPVEGASASGITQGMGELEIADSAGRGAARRRQDFSGLDNTRPPNLTDKKGTSGQQIILLANYFELLSKPEWVVHQYCVDFSPLVESSFMRKVMIHTHKEALGSCYIFDGMSDLKTLTKLDSGTELFTQRRTDNETIRITLKHVAELNSRHPELIRLFNTQMRRNLQHLKFTLLGRYYYDQNAVSEMPNHNLQVWQGVITSIRQQEEKLMMVVDTVHKVIRKETALEIIKGIVSRTSENYREEVAKDLVGSIVMTKYNDRTYRVEDICWELKPTATFDSRTGPISYMDYYQKQYDIRIRDTQQPLMLCTSKEKMIRGQDQKQQQRKIYLIPELCNMTGLTDEMRNNRMMLKDLAGHTKLPPNRRVQNLKTFISRIAGNKDVAAEMGQWGLKFSPNLVRISARVLPQEYIIQAAKRFPYDQKSAQFGKEMRGNPMHVAYNLEDWIVICTQRDGNVCNELLNTLNRVCPPMGMRVSQPKKILIHNDRVATYLQALRENMTKGTQLVLFIVPNDKKDRYDALKKNTCIECPVPSQVVITRTLSNKKNLMSVATKIGIQLNCKLGGEPWALEIPLKYGVMVIGYDTYHDSSKKGRSAGGFVASLNQTYTRWYSKVNFHQAGAWQEMSDNLKINVTAALRKYQQFNNCMPTLILFYRDGVGDGSIRYVKEYEVQQFENTLREINPEGMKDGKLRYSFIVVNKAINARFFAEQGNNILNPPPGTVVDSEVTRFDRYDFFLVSQSVREGTVGPTMYNIISDVSGLKPEHQQRLAYKLTHLYFNWQGTVRVPAPCQFAHKLAFLAGQSLHRQPAEELSDKLFFL